MNFLTHREITKNIVHNSRLKQESKNVYPKIRQDEGNKGIKHRRNKTNMADLNPNISTITLNINHLNIPVKKQNNRYQGKNRQPGPCILVLHIHSLIEKYNPEPEKMIGEPHTYGALTTLKTSFSFPSTLKLFLPQGLCTCCCSLHLEHYLHD